MDTKLNDEVYSQFFVVPKYGLKHEDVVSFQTLLKHKIVNYIYIYIYRVILYVYRVILYIHLIIYTR
jgi:hypothetical protein